MANAASLASFGRIKNYFIAWGWGAWHGPLVPKSDQSWERQKNHPTSFLPVLTSSLHVALSAASEQGWSHPTLQYCCASSTDLSGTWQGTNIQNCSKSSVRNEQMSGWKINIHVQEYLLFVPPTLPQLFLASKGICFFPSPSQHPEMLRYSWQKLLHTNPCTLLSYASGSDC